MDKAGKWFIHELVDLSLAAPSIFASLDSRYMSRLEERVKVAKVCKLGSLSKIAFDQIIDKNKLIDDVSKALYASILCSYAQGMKLIHEKSKDEKWELNLGELARIWKGGCIVDAYFFGPHQERICH